MIYYLWIGVLVGVILTLVLSLSSIYYKLYCDTESTTYTIACITISALTLPVLSLLLIPIDVYVVSTETIKNHNDLHLLQYYIHITYIILYITTLFYVYILLPYAYFYYEELDDYTQITQIDNTHINIQVNSIHTRKTALTYTVIFTTTSILLTIILWLLLHNILTPRSNAGDTWQDRLIQQFSNFNTIIWFNIGLLSCIGLCVFLIYTVYGLATVPIQWIRTAQSVNTEQQLINVLHNSNNNNSTVDTSSPLIRTPQQSYSEPLLPSSSSGTNTIDYQLKQNNESMKYLRMKYATNNIDELHQSSTRSPLPRSSSTVTSQISHSPRIDSMSLDDKREYIRLQRLNRQLELLHNQQQSNVTKMSNILIRLWNLLFPLRVLISLILFVTSMFIVVSLCITSVDHILHSECGFQCGYELIDLHYYNPMDYVMNYAAQYWPVDLVIFCIAVLYIYIVTIYGLNSLGVRIVIFKLYDLSYNNTYPHALILAAWQLLVLVYVFDLQLLTLIPTYITFGNQFSDRHYTPCTLDIADTDGYCVMTQISKFLYAMNIDMSLFQSIIICSNGVFVLFYTISTISSVCSRSDTQHQYKSISETDNDLLSV